MTDSAFSGKWVANVSGKKPYSAGFSCLLEDISRNGFSVINISFQGKKIKGDGRASLVTAINEGDELCFWSGNPIENQLNNSDWQPVTFQIVIDKNCPSDSKLSIYLFNPGLSEIWMDDLELGFQF